MTEYLKADQARYNMLEAQTLQGAYKKSETEAVLKQIDAASRNGEEKLVTSTGVDVVIASRLNSLGYITEITHDQRDGDFMTISW